MDKLIFKSTLRQGLLAGAAIVCMMGVAQQADAASYALSQMTVSNLLFTGPTFGPSVVFTSRTDATLFGSGPASSSSTSLVTYEFATNAACNAAAATGGCVDPLVRFISNGAPAPAENAFAPQTKAAASFGYADAIVTSTKINIANGATSGGAFKQIAEAAVNGGNATGQAGTSRQDWDFSINLTSGQTVSIDFDEALSMIADASDPNGLNAQATSSMQLQLLLNGQVVKTVDMTDLTTGLSALKGQSFSTGFGTKHTSGSITAAVAGDYLFRITSLSSTDVNAAAPEPATLSLMGLGLLGLGYASRRRRKTA
ncbi:MAG: PEP-CTERM sorting domain-containing protein [Proteobacteria bacterium]|nr:PEP-CTERM sorting domain-containing protein [Pseudomonadota bacterium]